MAIEAYDNGYEQASRAEQKATGRTLEAAGCMEYLRYSAFTGAVTGINAGSLKLVREAANTDPAPPIADTIDDVVDELDAALDGVAADRTLPSGDTVGETLDRLASRLQGADYGQAARRV